MRSPSPSLTLLNFQICKVNKKATFYNFRFDSFIKIYLQGWNDDGVETSKTVIFFIRFCEEVEQQLKLTSI
jgi:hypothetical protein